MTTPATLNLPMGEYQLSMAERAVRKKWRLPFVYRFSTWNDNVSTLVRRVRLNGDMRLVAEYKIAFGATFKLWAKTIRNLLASALHRLDDSYRKHRGLFELVRIILDLLSLLSKIRTVFKNNITRYATRRTITLRRTRTLRTRKMRQARSLIESLRAGVPDNLALA